ncbi:MAG: hypothetical protein LDLANPLL_02283 [Turneriella sp.]|nr:hypothetical protein [Turneriella sp.]
MGLTRNDKIFVLVAVFLFTVTAAVYNWYARFSLKPALDEKVVGKLVIRNNIAMRRFSGRLAWDDVVEKDTLYGNDAILTGENSLADLYLGDGFKLELLSNSMVELEMVNGELLIRLNSGQLRFDGAGKAPVKIITPSKKELKLDGAVGEVNGDSKDFALRIDSGKAQLGEKEIKANETVKQVGDKTQILQNTITAWQNPPQTLFTTETTQEMVFGSDNLKTGSLLLKQKMSNPAQSYPLVDGKKSVTLPQGVWYWCLSQDTKNCVTPLKSFNIVSNVRPQTAAPPEQVLIGEEDKIFLIEPSDGKIFFPESLTHNASLLRWRYALGKTVRIEIAHDTSFKNASVLTAKGTSEIPLPKLASGIYYWRVRAGEKKVSDTRMLQIAKKLLPPSGLTPPKDAQIEIDEEPSLKLSWHRVDGADYYRVRVWTQKENKTVTLLNQNTKHNGILLSHVEKMGTGEVFWQVSARQKIGDNKWRESAPARAQMNFTSLPVPAQIKIKSIRVLLPDED